MSKAPLSTQTGRLFIVIRKNVTIKKDKIKAYCETFGKEYAFIEHKNDIDAETGLVIPVHYHIVMNAKENKQRLSTHLNNCAKFFGFDSKDGLEFDSYRTYENALQYLIHKNDKEKTPHKIDEIVTNIDKDELTTLLTCETSVMTFEHVLITIKNSNNIIDVIRTLGISNYQRYRATIKDIWTELKEK